MVAAHQAHIAVANQFGDRAQHINCVRDIHLSAQRDITQDKQLVAGIEATKQIVDDDGVMLPDIRKATKLCDLLSWPRCRSLVNQYVTSPPPSQVAPAFPCPTSGKVARLMPLPAPSGLQVAPG